VALAIRFKCPIYANESVLDKAGIASSEFGTASEATQEEEEVEAITSDKKLDEQSISELDQMLNDAINNENYELASRIRDEINKRK